MGGEGWISGRLVRRAIARLHEGYEALPRPARLRWWRTLVVGFSLVLALTAALVEGARRLESAGALGWEHRAMEWVAADFPLSFSAAMWLEGPGNGFVLWGVVLFGAGLAAWRGRPLHSLALLLGHTLVYLPIGMGWWMWDRARPDGVMSGMASPGGAFRSYPSGHVVLAAFAYGLLVWLWIRASSSRGERAAAVGVFLLVVSMVAVGRIRVGAHWPSDLLAGLVIGLAWVGVVATAVRRAEGAGG